MAGIYNGHLLEFPTIRVDCFNPRPTTRTNSWTLPVPLRPHLPPLPAPNAQLFLLTHIHTDHLQGLTNSFTGKIICSPDTKRMLLKLEPESTRRRLHDGNVEMPELKYPGLKARRVVDGKGKTRVVDLIEAVPYNLPKEYEISDEKGKPFKVTITLIDANHCPGSAMFLVTSATKAILHTGDMRADRVFMQSLRRLPFLSEYFEPWHGVPITLEAKKNKKKLDRIYLDDSAMLGTADMPDKEEALMEMIRFMSLYPPDTVFFLDVWCFGWEDVVKEVARHFGVPVHVDRYKRSIYTAVQSDPYLTSCTTDDPNMTRFHACEKNFKCKGCQTYDVETRTRRWNKDKLVVQIKMAEVKTSAWDIERSSFLQALNDAALGESPWPNVIYVPIARHSTLPELQSFVSLFKPRALSPNVLALSQGLDYQLFTEIFADSLDGEALNGLLLERNAFFKTRGQPLSISCNDNVQELSSKYKNEMADSSIVNRQHQASLLIVKNQDRPSSHEHPIGGSRQAFADDQVERLMVAPSQGFSFQSFRSSTGLSRISTDYDTDDEKEMERARRKKHRRKQLLENANDINTGTSGRPPRVSISETVKTENSTVNKEEIICSESTSIEF